MRGFLSATTSFWRWSRVGMSIWKQSDVGMSIWRLDGGSGSNPTWGCPFGSNPTRGCPFGTNPTWGCPFGGSMGVQTDIPTKIPSQMSISTAKPRRYQRPMRFASQAEPPDAGAGARVYGWKKSARRFFHPRAYRAATTCLLCRILIAVHVEAHGDGRRERHEREVTARARCARTRVDAFVHRRGNLGPWVAAKEPYLAALEFCEFVLASKERGKKRPAHREHHQQRV